MDKLIPIEANQIFALVGISKNSGKTSVLNAILRAFPQYRWAVMSTGIDGEETDALYRTPKPPVSLQKGSLFVCDEESLKSGGSGISLLRRITMVGRILYIALAQRDIRVRITGAANVSSQRELIRALQEEGADKVLVDGALDRKSIALDQSIDALILCIGASFGSVDTIKGELRRLLIMRDIARLDASAYLRKRFASSEELLILKAGKWRKTGLMSILGQEDALHELWDSNVDSIFVPTAITDAVFESFEPKFRHLNRLIIRHPLSLQLSLGNLYKLSNFTHIESLIPFRLKAFALNSTAIGAAQPAADDFRAEIRQSFPQLNFMDIMEI